MEYKLCISSVTYNRVFKWVGLMRNLKKVADNYAGILFELNFLFVHDTKTKGVVKFIKFLITSLFLYKYEFKFIDGSNNLGESRDSAMDEVRINSNGFIGFIDDDDRYHENILNILEELITTNGYAGKLRNVSIINFGMSGNFGNLADEFSTPDKLNRLRYYDDNSETGCIPSMASFINITKWDISGLEFGFNPPSEETSPLMIFTVISDTVIHIGKDLMFRNRANNSLVSDMSKYSDKFISANVDKHVENIKSAWGYNLINKDEYNYILYRFVYNYISYIKHHGVNPDLCDELTRKYIPSK